MKNKIFYFILLLCPLLGLSQVWKGNKIGLDNKVPQPWTPLVVKASNDIITVQCWGRTYIFSGKSLVEQIYIKGQPMLVHPITYKFQNQKSTWKANTLKVVSQSASTVSIQMESNIQLNGTKLSQLITADIYYDGLIYFKTKLVANKRISNGISMQCSIVPDFTRYINRYANPTASNKTSWHSDKFADDDTAFIPYWWVGDAEKGLFWFAESPESWQDFKKSNAIQFRSHSDDSSVISLNFGSFDEDSEWTFDFGLQATPVKPFPKNWRERILIGSKDSNINIIWPEHGKPFGLKYFGFPEAENPILFNKHVKEITKPGKKTLVYNNITFMSAAVPEWKQNAVTWNAGAQDYSSDVKAYGDAFVRANLLDKSFHDFIIWKSRQFLISTKLDGYYLDYSMIGDLNQFKNIRESKRGAEKLPYYPFMEMRGLYERFYKMVKNENPENLVISHASARVVPSIIGFSDAYVDGEQFNNNVAKINAEYLEVTNLESFQSEYTGKAYGIPGIFLPSFNQKNYSKVGPTQSLAALLMAHDISVWPIYSARVVWDEMYAILKSFPKWQNANFISYYDPKALIITSSPDVLSSVYLNDNNEYLCVFSNINSNTVRSFSTININLDNYIIEKKVSRGAYKVNSKNRIETEIPGKDYLVLYLKQKK